MRYKAYYNRLDIGQLQPNQRPQDFISGSFDEDDDLQILQYRIREKGVEFIKRAIIVDTYYEEQFNKKIQQMKELGDNNGYIESK